MKTEEIIEAAPTKGRISHYEVIVPGQGVVFEDECYSICNSYIIKYQLMGVRPKTVYYED